MLGPHHPHEPSTLKVVQTDLSVSPVDYQKPAPVAPLRGWIFGDFVVFDLSVAAHHQVPAGGRMAEVNVAVGEGCLDGGGWTRSRLIGTERTRRG